MVEPGSADDWSGRTVGGRYVIEGPLGEGGMASVYLAHEQGFGVRKLVVKIPKVQILANPENRRRFIQETELMGRQQHPNVVRVISVGEEEGSPYLVVEYLGGGDLAKRIERSGGHQSCEQILEWLPSIAETLDSVHAMGIVHRDVKPGNILFNEQGHVFLSDFGIAASMDTEGTEGTDGQLTVAGGFVGSPAYAPPESFDRLLTPAYDQYSLACVVYRALCGELPYHAGSSSEYLAKKMKEDPAPLAHKVSGVPAGCVEAVMKALARAPGERFASCRGFSDAFRDAYLDETRGRGETLQGPPGRAGRTGRAGKGGGGGGSEGSGSGLGRAVAALAVLAALGAGAWLGRDPLQAWMAGLGEPETSRFQVGSSVEEIDRAMELCTEFSARPGECSRGDYETESLRSVALTPVELDRSEVTNAQFAAFVAATDYLTNAETEARASGREPWCYDGLLRQAGAFWRRPDGRTDAVETWPEHPVVCVSRGDAAAYCEWMEARLPTAEEWEVAARHGGERRTFPWGEEWDPDRVRWNAAGESPGTVPVGRLGGDGAGHFDLAGNVWEWTASDRGENAVLKGGSYYESNPANLRAAVEMTDLPHLRSRDWGFRCAREAL